MQPVYANSDTYGNGEPDADTHAYCYPVPLADLDSQRHPNGHCHRDGNRIRDAYTNAYRNRHAGYLPPLSSPDPALTEISRPSTRLVTPDWLGPHYVINQDFEQ